MSSPPGVTLNRREVVAALGTAGAVTTVGRFASVAEAEVTQEAPLTVRVYPGPVSPWVWARYGPAGLTDGWVRPHVAVLEAVERACEDVEAHATAQGIDLEVSVERGERIRRADLDVPPVVPDRQGVLDAFRDHLAGREALAGPICHLLCWWGPTHARVGYGGVRSETGHVASEPDEGAHAVVNVGATEVWDSRAVTVNMAVHEVFHAYLTDEETVDLVGTECDHDLGTAVREEGTLTVSPMATAYATPGIGTGTRWPGSGCTNGETVATQDDPAGVEAVEYTAACSEETLEGVTRYLERRLL